MKRFIFVLGLAMMLTSCARIQIVPQPADGMSQIDSSIVAVQNRIAVKITLADLTIRPAPIEANYCSFWVEVENQNDSPLSLSANDFVLIDSQGQQYPTLHPRALLELLKPKTPYLVPSPYVGYYYLGDQARSRVADQFRSEASYATSRRPEQIEIAALQQLEVLPDSKVDGIIYFAAELRTMNQFEVRYISNMVVDNEKLPMSFRFSVEKI